MTIQRHEFRDRIHMVTVHNGVVYLTGQVGTAGKTVEEQTEVALSRIDDLLSIVGTDKTKILQATVWLDDMRSFDEFNSVWDRWVSRENSPARSTGQTRLGKGIDVEITVIAAVE